MTLLAAYMDDLFAFCERAVSGGYLVAMVLICAMQYLYALYRTRRASELRDRLCRQIDDVHQDLRAVSRDRTLTSLENQILREFTEELDLDRTLDQLLRRLVADSKGGFAAYVPLSPSAAGRARVLGLSERAGEAMAIDPQFVRRVAKESVVRLRKDELYGSQLYDRLPTKDRTRFDHLFLAGVGAPENLTGVIVSTSLIPAGVSLEQQLELTQRLMQSLTGIVKHTEELKARDRQLQSIHEIMELRAVTDRKHTSPLDMVEAFVDRLREMTQAERAVLFLVTPEGNGPYKPLCRCGIPLSSSSVKRHADLEATLAGTALARKKPETFDSEQLRQLGINSIIGSAIVAPVTSPTGIAGALCLTRAAQEPFSSVRPELIDWAARYLSETVVRALHQAVSEWHARQDPLTELFNRRTFDHELAGALRTAATERDRCTLLMVDVDRFKGVNDRYGHLVGDEVLRCVSRVLKESVATLSTGPSGMAARFGGEEFALLLPGIRSEEAAWIGETIRCAVQVLPIHTPQGQINVTVSGGLAVFPEHGQSAEELIAAADAALYQAKASGRNRILTAAATPTV